MSDIGAMSWLGSYLAIAEFLPPIRTIYSFTIRHYLFQTSCNNPSIEAERKTFDFLEDYFMNQKTYSEEYKLKFEELEWIKMVLKLEFEQDKKEFDNNISLAEKFCVNSFTKRTDFMEQKAQQYIQKRF